MRFSTEQMQQQWLQICLNKFERCFVSPAILAQAFNIREAIAIVHNEKRLTKGITEQNITIAINAIDKAATVIVSPSLTSDFELRSHELVKDGETMTVAAKAEPSIYGIADISRHGSILSNRIGQPLFDKLALRDSEILMYDSAYFYSASDDCYVVDVRKEFTAQKYVLYLEMNHEDSSLHYQIQDDSQIYVGTINQNLLTQANIVFDNTVDPNTLAAQVAPQLPALLNIISVLAPNHINQDIANSFMQHYTYLMDKDNLEGSECSEAIAQEKKQFIAIVDEKITQYIAIKLCERMTNMLLETLNDPMIFDDLKSKAREALDKRLTPISLDELLIELDQLIDLNAEIMQAVLRHIDEYQEAKSLLEMKIAEGLPEDTRMSCLQILQMAKDVEDNQQLSLIATALTKMLQESYMAIQRKTEEVKLEMDQLNDELHYLLNSPSVSDDWKPFIQEQLNTTSVAFSLDLATKKIDLLKKCKHDTCQLIEQQKSRYLNVKDYLEALLDEETKNSFRGRRARLLLDTAHSKETLDYMPSSTIDTLIVQMDNAAVFLQRSNELQCMLLKNTNNTRRSHLFTQETSNNPPLSMTESIPTTADACNIM